MEIYYTNVCALGFEGRVDLVGSRKGSSGTSQNWILSLEPQTLSGGYEHRLAFLEQDFRRGLLGTQVSVMVMGKLEGVLMLMEPLAAPLK